MQNVSVKIGMFLLISFLSICLIGCSEPMTSKEDIQGTWMAIAREPGIPGRSGQVGFLIEFFSDNSVMLPSGKRSWSILKDGRVKIDDPGMSMHGLLKANTLTLTMPDETKVVFQKHK